MVTAAPNDTAPTGSTYRVIPPSRRLAAKASKPGQKRIDLKELVKRGQSAIDELSVEFEGWMKDKIDVLLEARRALKRCGPTTETITALLGSARDLEGQSKMLGYPFAGMIGASLCRLIEASPDKSLIPTILIDHHVDAVRAGFLENAGSTPEATVKSVVECLHDATERFLATQVTNEEVR